MDMNFGHIELSDEQAQLLDVATSFTREKSPVETVRKLLTGAQGFDASVWQTIVDLGWVGVAVPERFDGVGLSVAEVVPIIEQMGKQLMATPFCETTLAAQALIHSGTEEQKNTILPKLVSGEVATVALMERGGKWDLTQPDCKAISSGAGYELKGEKCFVGYAEAAEWIVVSVQLDGSPALFIVPKADLAGASIKRESIIDETKRSFSIDLTGVQVPASALLKTDNSVQTLAHLRQLGFLLSAAECCGGAIAVIEYTVEYLKTRKQFGKLIGSYQALKHPIVDAFVEYEKTRSHLYSAANCFGDQGVGEIATSMAKAQADATLSFAADRSIQFHGGFGFTYDCDAQLFRRRAAWHAALYGDAAYHRKLLADLIF